MRFMVLTAAALSLGLAMPAFAATNTTANEAGTNQSANAQSTPSMPLQHKIRQELAQGGFTDIQVMPQSFLVRAKDRDGNPVMMMINPNSVTAVTAIPNKQVAQNGRGDGAMGSSAMTHSAHAGNAVNTPNGNGSSSH